MEKYACPKCGDTRLQVVVRVWADLHQSEGNFETTIDGGEHDWDQHSPMVCDGCLHSGPASTFAEAEA